MKMKTEYGATAQVVTEQKHTSGIIFQDFMWIYEFQRIVVLYGKVQQTQYE